ncbi:RNA polymerase subunit sigma-24 [Clostridium formicaceticum]|uniref:RNA polymerase subunit sigma-24 n=2 Tax=Clostridium formicaceticum TaxID=1497 RepID=A0ABN4TCH7_9CLOT|nr:RNA polymerase subunit sigma-24 [Clostridium formicaceticum]
MGGAEMTKKKLQQIKGLHSEIEMLKNQIASIEPQMTSDKVKGSTLGHPYILHEITIHGIDKKYYNRKRKKYEKKLRQRLTELEILVEEINEFIEGVEDSLTRQILILKYVKGLSWEQVAAYIGGGNKAESLRKRVERFLGKN